MNRRSRRTPNIFSYHDYREFLRDWVDHLIANRELKSLRELSRQSGLSPGMLPLILAGDQPLSLKSFNKIKDHLGLKETELSYLKLIRTIQESESAEERREALKAVQKFSEYKKIHGGKVQRYQYLTKWFYSVVRQMVNLDGFKADPHWIRKQILAPVHAKETQKALDFLVDNEFIDVTDPKDPKQTRPTEVFEGGFARVALHQFYSQMLDLEKQSIYEIPRMERFVRAYTTSVNEEDFDRISKILKEAYEKIARLKKNSRKRKRVYHLNLGFFPVAQSETQWSDKDEK